MDLNIYNSKVIKPWGYEYLAYQNEEVGLWILHIAPNHSTSMHCHTKKTTGLIVLDGKIQISFIGDNTALSKLDKRMIRRGLFHSSKSISENETILLEIETPNHKSDLVRLTDNYGRKLAPYEKEFEKPQKDFLYIKESINKYEYGGCIIELFTFENAKDFINLNPNTLLVFLRGGILTNQNDKVVVPGDVGYVDIVKQVYKNIPNFSSDTLFLAIYSK
jgi:mannose-6-phosphate isomerase-like protein (cupin superfamily)